MQDILIKNGWEQYISRQQAISNRLNEGGLK
jgi:hypothetical protein